MTLRGWSTLGHEALAELVRNTDVVMITTLEEKQLLEAARERLITWRAPTRTKPNRSAAMNQEKKIETQTDTTKTVVGEFVADAVKDAVKETAAKEAAGIKQVDTFAKVKAAKPAAIKSKAAPAAKPAASAATPAAPAANKKEATVAKKSKPAAKKAATKTAPKSKAKAAPKVKAKGNGKTAAKKRVSPDAVLKVNKGFKNPFRDGSPPFKRMDLIAKNGDGKTFAALRKMAGVKPSTPLNFVRLGGGHFIESGK